MVTCRRQPFNILPMASINPFVAGISPSIAMAAAAAAAGVTVSPALPNVTSSPSSVNKPRIAFSIDSIVGPGPDGGKGQRTGEELEIPGGILNKRRTAVRNRVIISPSLSSSQRSDSPEMLERLQSDHSPGHSVRDDHPQRCQESRHDLALRKTLYDTPQCSVIYCRRRASLDRLCSPNRSSPRRSRSRSPLMTAYDEAHRERSPPMSPNGHPSAPLQPSVSTLSAADATDRSRSSPRATQLHEPNKGPLIVPGIPAGLLRPLPLQAPSLNLVPSNPSAPNEIGGAGGVGNSCLNADGSRVLTSLPPPSHLTSNQLPPLGSMHAATHLAAGPSAVPQTSSHFLAAHFQMAAALAHHHQQQQQQQQPQHPPIIHLPPGHAMNFFPPIPPHHPAFGSSANCGGSHHSLIRDSYPLYPWLLSRHGRIFPHRFPGNFLLQPFRKPKRVRTAFSPTQLLKLEHAFEGNHYVVGAERKQLAQGLSLTETQVKVWFQNRRTKHKRLQQEDVGDGKSNKGSQSGDTEGKNDSSQNSFEDRDDDEIDDDEMDEDEEDEVIDMDDYGAEINGEEHQRIREQFQQQLQQHHQQIQQHIQMQQHQQHLQQQQRQQQQQQQDLQRQVERHRIENQDQQHRVQAIEQQQQQQGEQQTQLLNHPHHKPILHQQQQPQQHQHFLQHQQQQQQYFMQQHQQNKQ